MNQDKQDKFRNIIEIRRKYNPQPSLPSSDTFFLSLLINLQQQCKNEFQKNQKLVFQYLKNKEKSIQTNIASESNGSSQEKNQKEGEKEKDHEQNGFIQNEVKNQEVVEQNFESQSNVSSFQGVPHRKRYKPSQSKNVPKNYSKAIFSFMKKNMHITKKVLKKYNIRQRDFKRSIERYRGNINTIMEFRSLWMDETNPYAKAYRVLSAHYMRKYSLSRIFNSRIQYHMRNLKYRYRVFEGISDPESLTHMKEY